MRGPTILVATLVCGACASAGKNEGADATSRSDGATIDPADAPIDGPPPIDAPPPFDAAPIAVTLSQTTSAALTAGNSVACHLNNITAENSYYRAFALSDAGLSDAFDINRVSIGIEQADAEVGTSQVAQLRIHSYTGARGGGTMPLAAMTLVNAVNIQINDVASPGGVVDFPITASIPAGGTFVVELAIPDSDADGNNQGNVMFIGSNTNGESHPAYLRAPSCDVNAPTRWDTLGIAGLTMHVVMSVTGTYNPP